MASVGLLRHWGDPAFAPPGLYFLNLGHANQLFSIASWAFSLVMPVAWATKLVVALSLLLLPVAATALADHLDAPRWSALLVAPLGLGWLFFWGLVQNIVGLVLLLAALPSIDRFARKPTGRGALGLCGLMIGFHFAHQAMQLVACLALLVFSLGERPTRRDYALRAIPVAFCAAVIVAAQTYAHKFAGPRHLNRQLFEWQTFGHKVTTIPGVLFGGFEPFVRNLMFGMAVLPVVLLYVARLALPVEPGTRRWHRWRFEIFVVAMLVLYFAAPLNITSTTLVYHRFLPPAWAVLAVCSGAGTASTVRWLPKLLSALLPVGSLLIGWPSFVDSNHVYSDLEAVMSKMEPGAAVMAINLGDDRGNFRLWNPIVGMGYVIAAHGGRAIYDYTQSPISIVSQRPAKQWGETVERLAGRLMQIRPRWDFEHFRYLLVATPKESLGIALSMAMHDDATLVASSGDWYLYESKRPMIAVDADEPLLKPPYPPSLTTGLDAVAKKLRDEASEGGEEQRAAPTNLGADAGAPISP